MKSNWTVGRKLGISFAVLVILLLGIGLSSLTAVRKLETALAVTGYKTARKIELAGKIDTAESDMIAAERGMIMFAAAKDSTGMDAAERSFHEALAELKKNSEELRSLAVLAETKERLTGLERQAEEWKSNLAQVSSLLHAGSVDGAVKFSVSRTNPLFDKLTADINQVSSTQNQLISSDLESATSLAHTSRLIGIALTLAGFGIGAIVLLVIRQVNRALRRLASQLSDGAAQVAGAAGQVSAAGQSLASGSSQQAASLEETSASSEEIATMTRRNAENSEEAARLMVGTTESVDGANHKMEEMICSMKEITASSDKISKIIKVIDEIAFQTNILALNAAVEAARAGEAGMGFAVVADEVRNLAQRCAQAARDTAELIEESINRSSDGSNRLAQVSGAIGAITEQSSKARVLVDEIFAGSKQQSLGIEQVAGAVSQMQQVTQSNAASAEESAAAGKELSGQAETLRHLVDELNIMVGKNGLEQHTRKAVPVAANPPGSGPRSLPPPVMRKSQAVPAARRAQFQEQEFPLGDDFN